jgi:hypothetical protein
MIGHATFPYVVIGPKELSTIIPKVAFFARNSRFTVLSDYFAYSTALVSRIT